MGIVVKENKILLEIIQHNGKCFLSKCLKNILNKPTYSNCNCPFDSICDNLLVKNNGRINDNYWKIKKEWAINELINRGEISILMETLL